jgi:PD-(D/E)XK nuclease superfamily
MCSRPNDIRSPIKNHEILAKIIDRWIGEDGILSEYEKLEEECKNKLPYHINLIDLLRLKLNEPTHSRIFGKLLGQKKGNKFQVLDGFVKYLGSRKVGFRDVEFKNPEVDIEKEHIDIRVWDARAQDSKARGKALIIENKVNDAVDQPEQLCRYIEAIKGEGIEEENIYIVYMPSDGEKEPKDQSWGKYKKKFEKRYLKVTLHDLLLWLRALLEEKELLKDEISLRSALQQYIDYLAGENVLRSDKRFETMNEELKKLIKEKLGFGELPADNLTESADRLEGIAVKIAHLTHIKNYLEEIEAEETDKRNANVFKSWEPRIKKKYKEGRVNIGDRDYSSDCKCRCIDISFPQEGIDRIFNVSIVGHESGYYYYGITPIKEGSENRASIKRIIEKAVPGKVLKYEADSDQLLIYYRDMNLSEAEEWLQKVIALVDTIDDFFRKRKSW